jgi:hypothetical protein
MIGREFKVGQVVCLLGMPHDPATASVVRYKILRLRHRDGRYPSYCVKTILEAEERFADHEELILFSKLWSSSVTNFPRG